MASNFQNIGGPPTQRPVSKARMESLGLDPAEFHSCCDAVPGVSLGCPVRHLCRLPEKKTNSGPLFLGVREIKRNEKKEPVIRNTVIDCYFIPHRAEELRLNSGSLTVIARAGEKIKLRGSEVEKTVKPGNQVAGVNDVLHDTVVPEYFDEKSDDMLNLAMARDAAEMDAAADEAATSKEAMREATASVSRGVRKGAG